MTDKNPQPLSFRDRSGPRRYPHICEALQSFTAKGTVNVEVGCGGKQYQPYVLGKHYGMDLQQGLYPGKGADTIGSAIQMPLRTGSVDFVFMVATLLFMDEWERPVEESCRILKDGGRLLIFDYKPSTAVRLGYPDRFTPQDLLEKLSAHGLQGHQHTEYFPIHHVGPLRNLALRRLISGVADLFSSWIVISGVKTPSKPS
jgi:SAM-dependent methyltransferase